MAKPKKSRKRRIRQIVISVQLVVISVQLATATMVNIVELIHLLRH